MDLYGLIGNPLSHSLSEKYFTDKFVVQNIDAGFQNFLLPGIENLRSIIETYPQLKGLSVTSPFKRDVIAYCDELDADAEAVMAVNALKISRKDKIIHIKGYNTDIDGFAIAMIPILKASKPSALILGSGGAARAVAMALGRMGIAFKIVSRTKGKGQLVYEQLNEKHFRSSRLIINATPLGMPKYPGKYPPIPYQYLSKSHILFDLNYNPPLTPFLQKGKEMKAATHNGLVMLQAQAEKAWHLWNMDK